jgi:hypothetical protein
MASVELIIVGIWLSLTGAICGRKCYDPQVQGMFLLGGFLPW